jgi:hypothetical protein
MRLVVAVLLGLGVGFAGGLFVGRWTAPSATGGVLEQSGIFEGPLDLGQREVFYPRPFASPPELTIVEEKRDPHSMWEWTVSEQRKDGFRLKFTGWGGTSRNPLRYTAKGVAAHPGE